MYVAARAPRIKFLYIDDEEKDLEDNLKVRN